MAQPQRERQAVIGGLSEFASAARIVKTQAEALHRLAGRMPADFSDAVTMITECRGNVIVTGMGKAGWIGQKVSASFASTGTCSHFMHPAEAIHGDFGRIGMQDIVLALSNSGETGEMVTLLPTLEKRGIPMIAMTAKADSTLARNASLILDYGPTAESDHLSLAPSTSTTVMLALGDALALTVSSKREFTAADFALSHPGGSLGRRLAKVEEVMRRIENCRTAVDSDTVRAIYIRHQSESRRTGAVMVVDEDGQLSGIFTDSDLARLLERQQDSQFDLPIADVMTRSPLTVEKGMRTELAIETLACRNISELPVVDSQRRPIGLIDITDVVNLA